MNRFINSSDNKRYHTLNFYYKKAFNARVSKISLDAHFTCPNIDGKVGYGGCIYCKQIPLEEDLLTQFAQQKEMINKKWPNSKYIGFFQANTNTYAPLDILKEKYELILKQPNVIGLSISTRPDAISDEVLDYLEELNKRTYLTMELGLQTIHGSTAKLTNRCHTLECFAGMVTKLRNRNINIVVHIINGLPYETKEMMIETVKFLSKLDIQGLKIHMLHIVKDTPLETLYNKQPFHILSKEEYIDIVCDQLEILPARIVIHRLTGDPFKQELVAPEWVLKKVSVLNGIDEELARRQTYQDFNRSIINKVHQILDERLRYNDIAIDATTGNGNDTLFLSKIVTKGHIYGFDIQSTAIKNTKELLDENKINNYTLLQESHENMLNVLPQLKNKVSAIIFNLGYLTKGDREITTKYETTLKAIEASLELLNNKGFIMLVVYPGHKEGLEESIQIKSYLERLDDTYNIREYHNTNKEDAPYLIVIDGQYKKES